MTYLAKTGVARDTLRAQHMLRDLSVVRLVTRLLVNHTEMRLLQRLGHRALHRSAPSRDPTARAFPQRLRRRNGQIRNGPHFQGQIQHHSCVQFTRLLRQTDGPNPVGQENRRVHLQQGNVVFVAHYFAVGREEAALRLLEDHFDAAHLFVGALGVETPGAHAGRPVVLVGALHAVGRSDEPVLADEGSAADEFAVPVQRHVPRSA